MPETYLYAQPISEKQHIHPEDASQDQLPDIYLYAWPISEKQNIQPEDATQDQLPETYLLSINEVVKRLYGWKLGVGLIRFAVTPDYTIYGGSKPNQTQTLNFQPFVQPLNNFSEKQHIHPDNATWDQMPEI